MKCNWNWVLGTAVVLPVAFGATCANAHDDPPTKKTSVVVVKSDGKEDTKEVRDAVMKQLEKSGISKEEQEKIMKRVEEALVHAEKSREHATKAAVEAEKTKANVIIKRFQKAAGEAKSEDGEKHEHTITIVNQDGKPMVLEALKDKLPEGMHGRVLQAMSSGGAYRIGIALSSTSDVTEEDGEETETTTGLKVETVMDDSPAKKAGILSGDIVISVDGKELNEASELQGVIQVAGKEDKPVSITIKRDGKNIDLKVKPTKTEGADFGVMNLNLTPEAGFVFEGKDWKGLAKAMPQMHQLHQLTNSDEVTKKELKELKDEVAELKAMIKKLLDKKD